jgi:signal transduction histidine kinase/ligand-binding sensor domain-containing protein
MSVKWLFACQLLFWSASGFSAAAQQRPYFIEKLSIAEGLSSNNINDLIQDDNGFLWIATSDGLNRFDGTEITQYYYQAAVNSLPHNYVYCLKKLPGNILAIGTQAGLSFYDGNADSFRNVYQMRHDALDEYNNTIIGLEQDTHGNLWVASRNCIYVFDDRQKLIKTFTTPFTAADVARTRLRYTAKMIPLSDGQVLLCLYDGWYISSAEANAVTRLEYSPFKDRLGFIPDVSTHVTGMGFEQYFAYGHVFRVFGRYLLCLRPDRDSLLLMDEQGRQLSACLFPFNKYPYILWSQRVATIDSGNLFFLFHDYGLGIIPVTWKNGEPAIHNLSRLLFESSEYNNALRDRQGNWWLATTDQGLQKISPYKQLFSNGTLVDGASGTQVKYETNFVSKYGRSLWVSTYGQGFFKIDLPTGRQQQIHLQNTGNDIWANFIWNLRQISADTLWVGTQAGLFWYALSSQRHGRIPAFPGKPAVLDTVSITTQFTDSRGLTWMGLGIGKGLCYFDRRRQHFTYFPGNSKEYPLRYPLDIAEDKNADLWFTNDASNLLMKWIRNTNQFKTVSLPFKSKDQISSLYAIHCEDDSLVWLGSVTNGLIKFNTLKNTITCYGHDRGLISSHILSICPDKANRLWLVTEGGLCCFDPQTETFFNYSEKEGLPVKFPTAFLFSDTLADRMYCGGKGVYFYFDPDSMNTSLPPQKTLITLLTVNDRPYRFQPGTPLDLATQQNDIAIHFASIDFNGGPQTKYAYKLIGEDTGWVMAGYQRQINFSHLAPGQYQFIVRSQNNQGISSSQEASIRFNIRLPFTQTGWFYGAIVLAIAGLFYSLYRFRLRQLIRTEQIRNEISRNLHDEVGSTLTNISLGSLLAQRQLKHGDPANRLLERIYQDSQTVSQTMREIVWSINSKIDTLGEALPRMLQYASEILEAKNIELQATTAPQIDQLKLTMERRRDLYLIFKEAVNNLARHSAASQARIRFDMKGTVLLMTIADNGKGFDRADPFMGSGLKNMKERAERHHWQFTIQSEPGAGTTLTVAAGIA